MNQYWQYFLALEDDLIKFSRYVEFDSSNYETYSIDLVRIYLSVCSEVDVVAKILANNLNNKDARNIGDYKKILLPFYPNITNLSIDIPKYRLAFTPWKEWEESKTISPVWWLKHNDVKHHRSEYYHEANLGNVLNAMAGLLVINLYYMKQQKLSLNNDTDILLEYEMRSKLFIPNKFKTELFVSGFIGWGGNIP